MAHPFFSSDPILTPDAVAVVTGAAGGIGRAAATRCLEAGMRTVIVDREADALHALEAEFQALDPRPGRVLAAPCDVSNASAMNELAARVFAEFGGVHLLMNNAGIQPGSDIFGPGETWDRILSVNLGGILNGCRAFVPRMIEAGQPGLVVNTGSKQGITMPPGDPAYNVSKAAVKAYTEALQHDLRNRETCRISAHLLIPGFVFTGLTARGRTDKPDGAWTAEETVDFMLSRLEEGDFYILCPDGEVTRDMDERRIAWAAGDIIENRPPLSRWHPEWSERFKSAASNR